MTDPFRLDGKRALVTGANTGIGQAIALGLARAGAHVVAAGRSPVEETLALIAAEGLSGEGSPSPSTTPRRRASSAGPARSTSSSTTPASSAAPTPSTSPRPTGTT